MYPNALEHTKAFPHRHVKNYKLRLDVANTSSTGLTVVDRPMITRWLLLIARTKSNHFQPYIRSGLLG